METLTWLHLTDLHQGMSSQDYLWPEIEHLFFSDLEKLHRRAGPFDLLLFTGDLTQKGTVGEFEELTKTLERIYKRLRRLGSNPVLLPVPGNHDLQRPLSKKLAVKLLLDRFLQDPSLREEFFTEPTSEYREVIDEAFAAYAAWWHEHRFPRPEKLHTGILPGEYAATFNKGNLSLGVVGLNTAFLQLASGEFAGKLHVDPRQFHHPCGGHGPAFIEAHHLCLLLTHHPPWWLSEESLRTLNAEIAPPGRFVVHLFGHMHEASTRTISEGASAPLRYWQGSSLFGLEYFGDGSVQRSHGYAAGRIEFDGQQTQLRMWPRRVIREPRGAFRLIPDYPGFDLDDDHGTHSETVPLRAPVSSFVEEAHRVAPPHPRESYKRAFYISRAKEERIALSLLQSPGAPVLLWGPTGRGKTWLLQHLLERCAAEGAQVIALNLSEFSDSARSSLDAFSREFAQYITKALGSGSEILDRVWKYGTPGTKLVSLMEHVLKPPRDSASRRVVLSIDRADSLFGLPFEDDFFGFLRAWADDQEGPWLNLRLLLSVAITPAMLTSKQTHSPLLNRVVPIHLPDFDSEQVEAMLHRAGLWRTSRDVSILMSLIGGHPYLVALALHNAHQHGLALRLFHDDEVLNRIFGEYLDERADWLATRADLQTALRKAMTDSACSLDPQLYEHLHRSGYLERNVDGGYRVPYRIYLKLLGKL